MNGKPLGLLSVLVDDVVQVVSASVGVVLVMWMFLMAVFY